MNTMGERSAPSPFQKEKHWSAKSDVSKVLFPDIGKITNRSRFDWYFGLLNLASRGGPCDNFAREPVA